jgi:NDP-sugar pyrophosphorylase family protein
MSDAGESVDIAERLRLASAKFHSGVFFCYGDTIADVSLHHVLQTFESKKAVAVLSVIPLKSSFGVFMDGDGGVITSYMEKPVLPYWINIGYGFLGPQALEILRDTPTMEQFLSTLRGTGRLFMHRHSGKHITFNTLSEREEAENAIRTL